MKKLTNLKKTLADHKMEIIVVGVAVVSATAATLITKKILVDDKVLLLVDPKHVLKMHINPDAGVVYETDLGNLILKLAPTE